MKYPLIIGMLLLLAACTTGNEITNFEECVEAGNSIMESFPRQCAANGETFTEELDDEDFPPAPELPDGEPVEYQAASFTACTGERPEVCTMEYVGVCAMKDNGVRCVTEPCASTDAVTEATGCTACSDESTVGWYDAACEDIQFAICESANGFDVDQIAQDAGWTCVDVCPGNYDSFVTQIGVELCIQSYGEEEILSWPACSESSESCDCVKAYETTKNEQIEDAAYRCAPKTYSERLLFRGGLDRLDENGEQSVMIA